MNKKILIVEDEIVAATGIKNILLDSGYDVLDLATNGESALDIFNNNNVDIVLMDIRLAGKMDGIEVAEKILTKRNIPIIFMTGYNDKSTVDRINKLNPAGFVVKPIDIFEILSLIEKNV